MENIPLWEKVTLTIEEASNYYGIGQTSLRNAIKNPSCTFVFYVGSKPMIKKREFDNYISKHNEL